MPKIAVEGPPSDTPVEVLQNLRALLIQVAAEKMKIKPSIIRPFFPTDMAGDPQPGQDRTIWVTIFTGMFVEHPEWSDRKQTLTDAVAKIVAAAFDNKIEVEVFIHDLNPEGKTLLKPEEAPNA